MIDLNGFEYGYRAGPGGDGLYKRAAEITGLNEGTLRDFKYLAGCFELSVRTDKLSWRHHREAA